MNKTIVINLFAGPGTGKSTLAAELFHKMKEMQLNVELVREYVKDWAWEGRKINPLDQFYITAKQFHREYKLYGKVDYVITDSPFVLGAFYEKYYHPHNILLEAVLNLAKEANNQGIAYHNYFLTRHKEYVQLGRYETEEQAINIDRELRNWMMFNGISFFDVVVSDKQRANLILQNLGLTNENIAN